jgi:hypothetical protein
METELIIASSEPDRFATCDEVRAALSLLPGFLLDNISDSFWEVPSDSGGYTLVEINEEEDGMTMYEKLNSMTN